jgi:hypothetical protein
MSLELGTPTVTSASLQEDDLVSAWNNDEEFQELYSRHPVPEQLSGSDENDADGASEEASGDESALSDEYESQFDSSESGTENTTIFREPDDR